MKQNPLLVHTIARVVAFIVLAFSIFIMLAGHNAPGGGFIGGLMTASAFLILYISFGMEKMEKVIRVDFTKIIGLGMFFAIGTGLNSLLFEDPFLTHYFDNFQLPILGEVELTTALTFDLGVYFVVVASATLIILSIARDRS